MQVDLQQCETDSGERYLCGRAWDYVFVVVRDGETRSLHIGRDEYQILRDLDLIEATTQAETAERSGDRHITPETDNVR